ncbi:hypothetical protein IPG41_05915 [Candidatus Peregrinibacteria bacterium]|nr:MAG: hypothetical protein IPG41_05915 [Candidatus Peregrinibacteria bacterium]
MKNCIHCELNFEWTPQDEEFLKKITPSLAGQRLDIPEPRLCAPCRRQRRYSFRNDRHLYKRKCSKTGRDIISINSPDKEYPIYAIDVWWSDAYDPLAYGREFDFSRPFFEQFAELSKVVPRPASSVVNSENCDYTAFTLQSRNSFLSSRLMNSEDIYYSYMAIQSRSSMDCYDINSCELCYECIDCQACYHCMATERSKGCHDLYFCADMSGCSDCFGCVGLAQKQYYFFNQPLNKEEYQKRIAEYLDGTAESYERARHAFEEHQKKSPVRALNIFNSENVVGSYVFGSRNIHYSFDIVDGEDLRNVTQAEGSKDLMDVDFATKAEVGYEVLSHGMNNGVYFSYAVIGGNSDVYYSMVVYNGNQNLFGCIGMKKNAYCILNKQYTKEEYEALVPRIVEHMRKTGEWGEFFPAALSNVGYNESCAMLLQPLTKEQALAQGYHWHDMEEVAPLEAEGENMVKCRESGRTFRLVPQELKFYAQMGLPRPSLHPDVRHEKRLARRNPYALHQTTCRKCGQSAWTKKTPVFSVA